MIKIAIDAMGGDYAPKEQVEGSMLAVKENKDLELTLYGNEEEINKYLTNRERIKVVNTNYVIPMGEKDPLRALREHHDSSLYVALESVKNGENQAIVSSGATQALVVGSHLVIRRMPEMKRVAIAPILPSIDGRGTILLDSGANTTITAEQMREHAHYATVYAREILGRKDPVVGLVNIGTEDGKGRDLDREIFELLKNDPKINFYGNVEPKTILNPPCDILLSDGFTANILMKTVEGTAKGVGVILKRELKRGFFGKIGLLFSIRNLKRLKKVLQPENVGGALICGLRAPVVKAQGASKAYGFSVGIDRAYKLVLNDVVGKVNEALRQEEENE